MSPSGIVVVGNVGTDGRTVSLALVNGAGPVSGWGGSTGTPEIDIEDVALQPVSGGAKLVAAGEAAGTPVLIRFTGAVEELQP